MKSENGNVERSNIMKSAIKILKEPRKKSENGNIERITIMKSEDGNIEITSI